LTMAEQLSIFTSRWDSLGIGGLAAKLPILLCKVGSPVMVILTVTRFYMSIRPTGCFLTLPQTTIEAIRDQAAAMILEGKTMMSYTDSGTSVGKKFAMDPQVALVECRYALQILNPMQYGNRDTVRVYNGLWNFRGL